MECETTGPCFSLDEKTLFLSVQHPGETNGKRQQKQVEQRQFALQTIDGKEFLQLRDVPIGSNWPGLGENDPPKPAVVAISRQDQSRISGEDRPLAPRRKP
jgi:secreted PhoX family phosphatase